MSMRHCERRNMNEPPPKNRKTSVKEQLVITTLPLALAAIFFLFRDIKIALLLLIETLVFFAIIAATRGENPLQKRKVKRQEQRETILRELAAINDPQGINRLVAVCYRGIGLREARPIAMRGLKNILPRLTAQDADCITSVGMETLI